MIGKMTQCTQRNGRALAMEMLLTKMAKSATLYRKEYG